MQGTGSIKRLTEYDIQQKVKETEQSLSKQTKAFVSLTKCYFRIGSTWHYAVICNNTKDKCLIRLDTDEYTPAYRWTNTRPLPGELYTNSSMDDIRVLQNLTNTAISQVESNRTRFAEPPIVANADLNGRMENKTFANRQWWFVDGDPSTQVKSLDVEDTSTNGIRAWQTYLGLLDKGSGGTLAEGQPGRNMPRAGGAMNNLLNLSLADIEDIANSIEQELLTPGLSDIFNIFQKYVPKSQLLKIPGKGKQLPRIISSSQLNGNYTFIWEGSLGFQDANQRADKLMQFMSILMQPQVLQVLMAQLQQQGNTLDFVSLFRNIYTHGLGERGLGELIVPIPPEVLQQQQAQQAQAMQQQQSQQRNDQQAQQADIAIKQQNAQTQQGKAASDIQSSQVDSHVKQLEAAMSMLSSMSSNGST